MDNRKISFHHASLQKINGEKLKYSSGTVLYLKFNL